MECVKNKKIEFQLSIRKKSVATILQLKRKTILDSIPSIDNVRDLSESRDLNGILNELIESLQLSKENNIIANISILEKMSFKTLPPNSKFIENLIPLAKAFESKFYIFKAISSLTIRTSKLSKELVEAGVLELCLDCLECDSQDYEDKLAALQCLAYLYYDLPLLTSESLIGLPNILIHLYYSGIFDENKEEFEITLFRLLHSLSINNPSSVKCFRSIVYGRLGGHESEELQVYIMILVTHYVKREEGLEFLVQDSDIAIQLLESACSRNSDLAFYSLLVIYEILSSLTETSIPKYNCNFECLLGNIGSIIISVLKDCQIEKNVKKVIIEIANLMIESEKLKHELDCKGIGLEFIKDFNSYGSDIQERILDFVYSLVSSDSHQIHDLWNSISLLRNPIFSPSSTTPPSHLIKLIVILRMCLEYLQECKEISISEELERLGIIPRLEELVLGENKRVGREAKGLLNLI